jgi:predicted lipid-binding transport protein (Tim44 family)
MFIKYRPAWTNMAKSYKQAYMPINRLLPFSSMMNFGTKKPPTVGEGLTDWEQNDMKEIKHYLNAKMRSKLHEKLTSQRKVPLERKRKKRAEKLEREANFEAPAPEAEQLIVHNPNMPITYPPGPFDIFAIIKINGKQYKVTKDETVMIETPNFEKQ